MSDASRSTSQSGTETGRGARDATPLPRSGAAFERGLNALLSGASALAVVLVLAYLRFAVALDAAQWLALAAVCAGAFPVLLASNLVYNRWFLRPIAAWLDGDAGASARAAHDAVLRLPRYLWVQGAITWSVGSALVAALARWVDDAIDARTAWAIALSGISAGFVSISHLYFRVKSRHRALLAALAARAREERGGSTIARAPVVRLRTKLLTATCGVALAATGLAVWVVVDASGVRHERRELDLLARAVAAELDDAPAALAAARARLVALGIADALALVDADPQRAPAELAVPDAGAVAAVVRNGLARGARAGAERVGPVLVAWHRLSGAAGDRALVAVAPRVGAALDATSLALVAAIAAALAFGVAHLLARDLATSVDDLRRAADDVAGGDLGPRVRVDAEDELGDLGRAFDAMTDALRAAVAGVVATVDGVESQASLLASDAMDVAAGASAQRRGIAGVSAALDAVRDQAAEIEASGRDLRAAVDESAGVIAELAASSRAVEGMAGAFGERLDLASSSVEQLVRSVQSVGASTRALSDAASHTAGAMRDTASALRDAERVAEDGAALAQDAMAGAERGRATVGLVQDGMASIRSATHGAEAVVGRLAGHVAQIGAILDVIDDVAAETNLLALNAAIIAAQSGEHGRAFSVVADEIKELADRVLASTKEIGAVVRAVQSESANAAVAIGESARCVDAGLSQSAEAAVALEAIESTSRETGRRIEAIAAAVRAQAHAAAGVVDSMDRVRVGAAEIDRAMEEQERTNRLVLDAASGIRDLSAQLARTTSEQTLGTAAIAHGVEGVRGAVDEIEASVRGQIAACAEVVASIGAVADGTVSHEEVAQRIGVATAALREHAHRLRSEVERFRVEG